MLLDMEAAESSSVYVVRDPEAARVLTDAAQLRYFAPFLAQDRTIAQVAEETGSKLNTAYVRTRRYLELGLLRVVREEKRAGRAVKVYRSVADVLYVPLAGPVDLENYLRWNGFWEREIVKGLLYAHGEGSRRWGSRVYRDAEGVLTESLALGPREDYDPTAPGEPAMFNRFHDSMYLDYPDAKAFQRELDALMRKYGSRGGAQRYIVRFNLVPVPEDAEVIP